MEADHVESLPAKAEREMRIGGIGSDVRVPIEMGGIKFVQQAKLLPRKPLELEFVCVSRGLENGDEGRVFTQLSPHPALSQGEREFSHRATLGLRATMCARASSFSLREKVRMRVMLVMCPSEIVKRRRKFHRRVAAA
jgi:hypothetical protein